MRACRSTTTWRPSPTGAGVEVGLVLQAVYEVHHALLREKVGKPVDKMEWQMTPQTINAYYNPTTNEICFPAAILQPPFFDPKADDAANLGAIG